MGELGALVGPQATASNSSSPPSIPRGNGLNNFSKGRPKSLYLTRQTQVALFDANDSKVIHAGPPIAFLGMPDTYYRTQSWIIGSMLGRSSRVDTVCTRASSFSLGQFMSANSGLMREISVSRPHSSSLPLYSPS